MDLMLEFEKELFHELASLDTEAALELLADIGDQLDDLINLPGQTACRIQDDPACEAPRETWYVGNGKKANCRPTEPNVRDQDNRLYESNMRFGHIRGNRLNVCSARADFVRVGTLNRYNDAVVYHSASNVDAGDGVGGLHSVKKGSAGCHIRYRDRNGFGMVELGIVECFYTYGKREPSE